MHEYVQKSTNIAFLSASNPTNVNGSLLSHFPPPSNPAAIIPPLLTLAVSFRSSPERSEDQITAAIITPTNTNHNFRIPLWYQFFIVPHTKIQLSFLHIIAKINS